MWEDKPLAMQVSGSHRDMTGFCRGECPTTTLPPFDYLRLSSRQPDIPLITKETIVIPWKNESPVPVNHGRPSLCHVGGNNFSAIILNYGNWWVQCEKLNYSSQCNLKLRLNLDRINSLEY